MTVASQRYPRNYAVDVARGFCLVIMTVDHLPRNVLGRFTNVMFGPFGFFTGASGFVFLSGLVCAWVYGRVLRKQGAVAACQRVLWRAGQLYLVNMGLFLLIFAGVLLHVLTGAPWVTEFAPFFAEPGDALYRGLLLQYHPGYLSILPIYVFLVLIVPPALMGIQASKAGMVMGLSILTWLSIQVWQPPESDSLNPLAYQVLFVAGLMIGSVRDMDARLRSERMIRISQASLAFAAILLLVRLGMGLARRTRLDVPYWDVLVGLETNGPLRVANFALFALGFAYVWPRVPLQLRESSPLRWLAYLGRHSLSVFAWSVLVTYVSVALALPLHATSHLWSAINIVLAVSSLAIPARLHEIVVQRAHRSIRGPGAWLP